jgi:predicted O-methyltransferase YrrM
MSGVGRAIRNIVKLPQRSAVGISRLFSPAYRLERRARRFSKQQLGDALYRRLCAVPGLTSDRKCELLFFLASTMQTPAVILEIGSYKGKSTAWLAEAARRNSRRMVTIDPHMADSLQTFLGVVKEFEIEEVATIHRTLSHEIGEKWTDPIGFLWVDGSHEYAGVRQDVIDFAPHVVPGAYVVFDDANNPKLPGVRQAIQETIARDPAFAFVGQLRQLGVFRKIAPPASAS